MPQSGVDTSTALCVGLTSREVQCIYYVNGKKYSNLALFRRPDSHLATLTRYWPIQPSGFFTGCKPLRQWQPSPPHLRILLLPPTMASLPETQALTRAYRPFPVLSKTTRQMVPPFVQKLYEFVPRRLPSQYQFNILPLLGW